MPTYFEDLASDFAQRLGKKAIAEGKAPDVHRELSWFLERVWKDGKRAGLRQAEEMTRTVRNAATDLERQLKNLETELNSHE